MVGPGGTTARWCRWYSRLVRWRLGEAPRAARAGTGQKTARHGGTGGPPGGPGTITPAMLTDTFPGWRVSESGGTYRARWGGPRERNGPGPPRRVLEAPDPTALAEKLCLQERINRTGELTAAELAAVWRDGVALPALTGAAS